MPTLGGTIKLQGEAEYRKAISQCNASIKTTASELKLLATQYDKDNQSVEGFKKQNEALEKQIEQQKQKIATLKGAVEDSASAYGESDSKTQKWQQSLNSAEAELIKMQRQVDSNNKSISEMESATDETSKEVNDFAKATEDAGNSALSMGDIIKANLTSEAIISGVKALANAAVEAGKALISAVVDSAAYADNMLTLSTNTGIAVEKLQAYDTVSELIDVSTETMTKSMAKNIKSMTTAAKGTGDVADAYNRLGVSVTDSSGNLRDSESVYWELIDSLGQVEDETERNSLSMTILGKSAQDLNSLIAVGSDGFADLTEKAEGMNSTLSEDSMKALGDVDDSIQWLQASVGNTSKLFTSAFAPAISELIDSATSVTSSFNGLLQAFATGGDVETAKKDLFDNLSTMLKNAFDDIIKILDELIVPLFETLVELVPKFLPQLINFVVKTATKLGLIIIEKLPLIINTLLQCVTNILNTLAEPDFLPKIIDTIVNIIPQIAKSILINLPTLLSAIMNIGTSLIEGLWNGIADKIGWIKEKIRGFGQSVLQSIKNVFGIHSPSKVFKEEIGKNLALGIGEGFNAEMPNVNDMISGAVETDYSIGVNASASGSMRPMSQMNMVEAFKEALKSFKADVILNDTKVGDFVVDKVSREVFV